MKKDIVTMFFNAGYEILLRTNPKELLVNTSQPLRFKVFVLSLILSLNYANAYELKFDKHFETFLNPNTLNTHISVQSEANKESDVSLSLQKFNAFFKKIKKLKLSKGRLNISPRYEYSKEKTVCKGYEGTLSYSIKAKNAKDMSEFISGFYAYKNKVAPKVKTQISNVTWQIGKKTYERKVDQLRIKALLWAKSYMKDLQKSLGAKCSLKLANFDPSPRYTPNYRMMSYEKKFSSNTQIVPMQNEQSISIHPNFVMECK